MKRDKRRLTEVCQTFPEVQTTYDRHDCGRNHEQITGHGNGGEKRPNLEHVSEEGACEHSRPKGKEECVDHREEDESPLDLSEDRPPALFNVFSEIRQRAGKELTDIIHGASTWNAIAILVNFSSSGPGNRFTDHSEDKECGLIRLDVPSEGRNHRTREEINPQPNRQASEERGQLQEH
jgi:hypothetical protein